MLRHTKLTELAEMGLGEFQMKQFAGWTANSKMPQRYIHMSGRSHIPAVLLLQGIEVEKQDKKPPIPESGRCPKCNSPGGPRLMFTALTLRTRFWIFFAVLVNVAYIGSGGDLVLLAAQFGVSPGYFRWISASLFLMGYILLIPWGLVAVRRRKRRIPESSEADCSP